MSVIGHGVEIVTSSTRPASPFDGMQIYETDTRKMLVYDGASWRPTGNLDIATSSTRPTPTFEGAFLYETDTNKVLVYSGSSWVEVFDIDNTAGIFYRTSGASSGESSSVKINTKPWNMPWGYVTSSYKVGNITNIATGETTALTLSVPEISGRRYKFTWNIYGQKEGSSGTALIRFRRSGALQQYNQEGYPPGDYTQSGVWLRSNNSTSSVSWTLTVQYSGNTLNKIYGDGSSTYIIVEDIGPT